jgi:hypothetical protein
MKAKGWRPNYLSMQKPIEEYPDHSLGPLEKSTYTARAQPAGGDQDMSPMGRFARGTRLFLVPFSHCLSRGTVENGLIILNSFGC